MPAPFPSFNRRLPTAAAAIGGLFIAMLSAPAQVTLTKLGSIWPTDISNDGTVVVGYGYSPAASGTEPLRWTGTTGTTNPFGLSASNTGSGLSVSGDGALVGGSGYGLNQAFLWTQAGGITQLGTLSGGIRSFVGGISSDGKTVVGGSNTGSGVNEAFRWTAADGMVSLGSLGGNTAALAVSGDGSIIMGQGLLASGSERTFIWNQTDGMVPLIAPPNTSLLGYGMNSPGTLVVGGEYNFTYNSHQAFRWSESEGAVTLGKYQGFKQSIAFGISDDGSTIIGNGNGARGFIWTPDAGMRDLLSVVRQDFGLADEVDRWISMTPQAISADGRYITGVGNVGGRVEGWLLDRGNDPQNIAAATPLSPVPEPSIYGPGAVAFLLGVVVRRRLVKRKRAFSGSMVASSR